MFCVLCRLHVGPLTLPETLTVMASALHKGAWGKYHGLKHLSEAGIRGLLSEGALLGSLAELSGIPRAMQWAYSVLKQPKIMKIVADHYDGFDFPVAVSVRRELEDKVSAPIMAVKRLV